MVKKDICFHFKNQSLLPLLNIPPPNTTFLDSNTEHFFSAKHLLPDTLKFYNAIVAIVFRVGVLIGELHSPKMKSCRLQTKINVQ